LPGGRERRKVKEKGKARKLHIRQPGDPAAVPVRLALIKKKGGKGTERNQRKGAATL